MTCHPRLHSLKRCESDVWKPGRHNSWHPNKAASCHDLAPPSDDESACRFEIPSWKSESEKKISSRNSIANESKMRNPRSNRNLHQLVIPNPLYLVLPTRRKGDSNLVTLPKPMRPRRLLDLHLVRHQQHRPTMTASHQQFPTPERLRQEATRNRLSLVGRLLLQPRLPRQKKAEM